MRCCSSIDSIARHGSACCQKRSWHWRFHRKTPNILPLGWEYWNQPYFFTNEPDGWYGNANSLARQGEFLLSYGNTIRGQHLALYGRNGEEEWTYHIEAPAIESSKAVIVPDYPLIIAGIQRDQHYYLQGFTLTGRLLWVAPLLEPLFDFRVSHDGRYVAAATDSTLYFFDIQPIEGPKAELQR
jgi:hypothetical protein